VREADQLREQGHEQEDRHALDRRLEEFEQVLHVTRKEDRMIGRDEVLHPRRSGRVGHEHLDGHAVHVGLGVVELAPVRKSNERLVGSGCREQSNPLRVRNPVGDGERRPHPRVLLRVLAPERRSGLHLLHRQMQRLQLFDRLVFTGGQIFLADLERDVRHGTTPRSKRTRLSGPWTMNLR
jgi:hypothetical protein